MNNKYYAEVKNRDGRLLRHYIISGGNYQFCWHRSMEIMMVLSGSAQVFAGGMRYELKQHDILLINSNCGHSTFFDNPNSLILICEIEPLFFKHYFYNDISRYQLYCFSSENERYSRLYTELRFLLAKSFVYAFEEGETARRLSSHYMVNLIAEIMQHLPTEILSPDDTESEVNPSLQKVIEYIEENYDRKLTLAEVADVVQYNRTYLSTLFRKNTGILFNDYITRVRLRHAMEQLGDSRSSLVDIALQNGFPDSKAFCSSIKKYCGKTPQEYRADLQKSPELRAMQTNDRYFMRPDAEVERLLMQIISGIASQETAGLADKNKISEVSDKMSALAAELRALI